MAGHPRGLGRAGRRPHRLRQDPGRLPRRPGPARLDPSPRRPQEALPGPVHLPAEGPGRGRRAQPSQPPDRHPPGIRTDGPARARGQGGHPLGRHPRSRAPRPVHPPSGHPDHHPRVAVPDADVGHARRADRRGHGDPRRGARGRGHQARRPPRALPGAAGRPPPEARPPHRPFRDGPPGRRGGPFPLAAAQGGDRPAGVGQGVRPLRGRPGRGPGRAGRLPGGGRLGGRRAPVDLAACGGEDHRSGPVAPLHDRLRELPAPRGAPVQPPERDRVRTGHGRDPRRAPLPRRAHGRLGGRPGRAPGHRPCPPRLGVQGAACPGRGGPEGGPPARGRGHVQSRTGHRHGRGRPGGPGRIAALGGLRPATRRPGGPPGGRGLHRRGLPEVPRRPGPGGGGHGAHADRRHRVPQGPRQPAGRPGPAARGDDGHGHLAVRRPPRRRPTGRTLRLAPGIGLHGGPRHAGRPLPVRRLRRAAPARGVGPRHGRDHGPPRRPAPRRHLRGHDPRPRPLRRLPRRRRSQERRRPGRRARRGDGLRVPCGRRLHARHEFLAHRGHHPRPGSGLPGPGRAGPAALLEGRPTGPPARAGPGGRRVPARGRLAAQGRCPAPPPRRRPGRVGGGQRALLPRRAAGGLRPRPGRPDDRRGALPRRARRLARGRALALRRPGARPLGPRARREALRALRDGRAGHARRRRHSAAPAGRRPDGPGPARPGAGEDGPGVRRRAGPRGRRRRRLRQGRGRPGRHRSGGQLGAVRGPFPRVRRPRAAAAAPQPGQAHAAVAAAPARLPAAPGGERVRLVPDRPGGGPRVPPGRFRRPRARRADGRPGVPQGAPRRGHHSRAVPLRALPPLRLRRPVPVRGRLPARRAPRRRPVAGLTAAGRAAGPGGAARAARRGGAHGAGAGASVADRGPPRQGRRGRRGPPPPPRPAHGGGTGRAGRRTAMGSGPGRRPACHPGPDRGQRPLGGDRGRGPAARRAGHRPAGRRPGGLHGARQGPARRPPRALRPHPWPVHLDHGGIPLRPGRGRHRGRPPAAGRGGPGRPGRVPPGRDRPGVVRRGRAAPAAPPFPGRPAP
ncbi:putative ATP-dependent helicase lhr [Streptomyces afghaniensis 772]|uniref:Putative ATP-dependent helicase lhr n=1 Tax=Streptomyces afghaniensis 772 TaxID=1283301 RepID=S4MIT8_9ACTN|nr:putative ATP-dependent helicase lhr [Streptomyces afghaniensis 772]